MSNEEALADVSGTGGARILGLLESYDAPTIARGGRYVGDGKVIEIRRSAGDHEVKALVQGTDLYHVTLGPYEKHKLSSSCTCRAFASEGRCKHIAAVALIIHRESRTDSLRAQPLAAQRTAALAASQPEPFPPILRHVYSATTFLSRLSLHAGVHVGEGYDRWAPLSDWWARTNLARTPAVIAMRRHVLDHVAEITRDVETLRRWTPPPPPPTETLYTQVYASLAELYIA